MYKLVSIALALAGTCQIALGGELVGRKPGTAKDSMQFAWHAEQPPDVCGDTCRHWISAVGLITPQTPGDFEVFARKHKVRGATVVLDSQGGSVEGAMELGRMIRRLGMTTTIGTTVSSTGLARASVASDVSCASMCAFVMLAGTRRHVPPEARVMVHQIWLAKKRTKILASSYTATELALVQQDIAKLALYSMEMAGNIELLALSLQVPAWEPMRRLSTDDVRRASLTTADTLLETDAAPATVGRSLAPVADTVGGKRD